MGGCLGRSSGDSPVLPAPTVPTGRPTTQNTPKDNVVPDKLRQICEEESDEEEHLRESERKYQTTSL